MGLICMHFLVKGHRECFFLFFVGGSNSSLPPLIPLSCDSIAGGLESLFLSEAESMEAMSSNRNQRTVMFASGDQGLSSARSCSDGVASNLPVKDRQTRGPRNLTDKRKLAPMSVAYELSKWAFAGQP